MSRQNYIVHTEDEIKGIRLACQAVASVREGVAKAARPGMSTKELDDIAALLIKSTGGTSAFLGYRGFPGQICISLNDEVVHGIGSVGRVLQYGDVVSIDVGVTLDGFIGDSAKTFIIGPAASAEITSLLEATEVALMDGIGAAVAGNFVRDIGVAVEAVANKSGYGVVREYVGHGCGCHLHEPPEVPNFATKYKGPELVPGMVLAIEPMFNLGSHKVFTESDNWTVKTVDGKISAHFEHMVLITETESEILTWQKM